MSSYLISGALLNLWATLFAVQVSPASPAVPSKNLQPPITLTGCVSQDATTPGAYTFSDAKTGVKYRLSGVATGKDDGKRGEYVIGTGAHRVTIRGGFVPSANVAAQAGALDPARAAVAGLPGGTNSGTGNVRLPEFRATRVQATKGSCP